MNTTTLPLEAETRVLIDRTLQNLGWKLDGKDKNVLINFLFSLFVKEYLL